MLILSCHISSLFSVKLSSLTADKVHLCQLRFSCSVAETIATILWCGYRLACEQALRGALSAGREKEGKLATKSLEFDYMHLKSRCEMLIGRDDISTSFAVHYEKIRIHLRETATNSAKIHSLARKSEHLRINQIQ